MVQFVLQLFSGVIQKIRRQSIPRKSAREREASSLLSFFKRHERERERRERSRGRKKPKIGRRGKRSKGLQQQVTDEAFRRLGSSFLQSLFLSLSSANERTSASCGGVVTSSETATDCTDCIGIISGCGVSSRIPSSSAAAAGISGI